MFSTRKKKRAEVSETAFRCHVFTVRYSIRFVYQAWLSWIALLSYCKATTDVVGCKRGRGMFSIIGSMATMTLL